MSLSAGKIRLALLHKGLAALGVILALKRAGHPGLAGLEVALVRILYRLADDEFDGIDRDRRIAGDRLRVILDEFLKLALGVRENAIDETHGLGVARGELPRGVEHLLGEGRADQIDQLLEAVIAVAEPEPRRRHAELRALGADAHVAAQREAEATADAVAANHGEGGLR